MLLTNYHKQAIVDSVRNDMPDLKADVRRRAQLALFAAMSPEVYGLHINFPTALRKQCMYSLGYEHIIVGNLEEEQANKIAQPFVDELTVHDNAITAVIKAIEHCSTRKQFVDAFPEFEKYAPYEAAPGRNLPAISNMVANLTKLGWPKQQQAA